MTTEVKTLLIPEDAYTTVLKADLANHASAITAITIAAPAIAKQALRHAKGIIAAHQDSMNEIGIDADNGGLQHAAAILDGIITAITEATSQ